MSGTAAGRNCSSSLFLHLCSSTMTTTTTNRVLTTAVAVLVVVAMVVGSVTCADCKGNGSKHTLLTFNTALTTVLPDYKLRRPAVVDALKSQADEADVMCLQELWFEKDVKTVLDELGEEFPYHYSAIHHGLGELRDSPTNQWFWQPAGQDTCPCSLWRLLKFFACFGLYCRSSDNLHQCVLEKCETTLYALSQDCRICVSISSSGPSDVLAKCADVFEEFNRINRPGLLMLSKKPLRRVQYVNYHEGYKVLLERGYIKAQDADGLTYVCTHLTSVFTQYFEKGLTKFKSFLEEQQAEIRQLNSTFFNTPHVLLGDLNTGPARDEAGLPKLQGEAPTSYAMLTQRLHYQSPYMQNDGRCTYCPSENLLLKSNPVKLGTDKIAIDHVMPSPRVSADVSSAKRVLDREDILVSDHYGVQVDICWP